MAKAGRGGSVWLLSLGLSGIARQLGCECAATQSLCVSVSTRLTSHFLIGGGAKQLNSASAIDLVQTRQGLHWAERPCGTPDAKSVRAAFSILI